ncbi:MAG: PP2C family protein-serine/threonine phosphatase, partial [Fimbriiglobus sp.]
RTRSRNPTPMTPDPADFDAARRLNADLRAAFAEIERGQELARRVHRLLLPETLPPGIAVHHRPRARTGGSLYDAFPLDARRTAFWVAAPGGSAATGGLLGVVIKHAAGAARGKPPAAVLERVNRELVGLRLDPPPLAGMAYGVVDFPTGDVTVSRGGLPPPVHLPADGAAAAWVGPGPFLGAFDADFPVTSGNLKPGERLLLRTGLANVAADPLPPAAVRCRDRTGAEFADAVARTVGVIADDEDEFTLMVVAMELAGR